MNWNPFAWFQRKPKKCDHVYFPVMMDGKPIGQECAICHKFDSVEEVLGSTCGDHITILKCQTNRLKTASILCGEIMVEEKVFTLADFEKGDTITYRSNGKLLTAVVWGKTSLPIPGDPEYVWIPHSSGKLQEILVRNIVNLKKVDSSRSS